MDNGYRIRMGNLGERFAGELLGSLGFHVIARNYRCYQGEIDVIARKGQVLHFIEVKTRIGSGTGRPEEAVTTTKLKNMRGAAGYYLSRLGEESYEAVFDVMAIQIDFIENCA